MQFETKYSFGDVVYYSTTESREVRTVCPECNGEKTFAVVGKDFRAACRRCRHRSYGQPVGYLSSYETVPAYRRVTIGQIRLEVTDSPGCDDTSAFEVISTDGNGNGNFSPIQKREERYMALETGIGSGSLYDVERLFDTPEGALEHGAILVAEHNKRLADEAEAQRKREEEYARVVESDEA